MMTSDLSYSSSTLTVSQAGIYQLSVGYCFEISSNRNWGAVFVNGVEFSTNSYRVPAKPPTGSSPPGQEMNSATMLIQLSANDQVTIRYINTGGGSVNIVGPGNYTPGPGAVNDCVSSFMTIIRLK